MKSITILNYVLFAISIGILVTVLVPYRAIKKQFSSLKSESSDLLKKAEKEAQDFKRKAEQESQRSIANSRKAIEEEIKNKRQSINQIENRILQKEK